MSKIVIALGGNALGKNSQEQLKLLKKVSKIIIKLIKDGNEIVITHGNGPQVGQIVLSMDYASENGAGTPSMPFPECGSMSQGYIGYQMQQSLQNEMKKQGIRKQCASLVTQVLVNKKDKAFQKPTKPVGMFYTKEEAKKIKKEKHYDFVEDAGRGYRRVVPSPKPIEIIEGNIIKTLVDNKVLVIAVGGGGVPVIKEAGKLKGVPAVIDKDKSASLLAKTIDADKLVILTAVDKVSIGYNTPKQKDLSSLTYEEAQNYIAKNEFASGSMLPKVEACLDFVKDSNKEALITSLDKAAEALHGKTGTVIKFK